MINCCTTQTSKAMCPTCVNKSNSAPKETLLHNLVFPLNMEVDEEQHFYCADTDCDVGYFTDSGVTFNKTEIGAYDQFKKGWLCYCFGISASAYKSALMQGEAKPIKSFVIEQTKHGTCACEIRNPSGKCCLADFKRLEKQHESS